MITFGLLRLKLKIETQLAVKIFIICQLISFTTSSGQFNCETGRLTRTFYSNFIGFLIGTLAAITGTNTRTNGTWRA